jgi:hypothetical protein
MTHAPALTVLNLYSLTGTADDFRRAIGALSARVETEGERGILAYRFYVNAAAGTARGVVDYASPAAWIGHHDLSMHWPEMKALHATARLTEATFLGEVTPAIRDWLAGSSLTARIDDGFIPVSAFRREAAVDTP